MDLRSAIFSTLVLIAALFVLATLVERHAALFQARPRWRHLAYTLALGVYCSSWTFYGAVGSAVRDGWNYLPIYLAPMLLLAFAPRFIERLANAVAAERATSAADFIAARFGNDVAVARLVTLIALLGSIPYIALQLRSIGNAMMIVSGQGVTQPAMIVAAGLLALFAVLFGARRYEVAGRSEGLVYAIGVDSLFKLLALTTVAGLAVAALMNMQPSNVASALAGFQQRFEPGHLSLETAVIALISAAAIIVLPRQFHMALVEAHDPSDLPRARFGLIGFLGIMAVLILPISLAGIGMLGSTASPDSFVLEIPAELGNVQVLTLALLGGVSAAASMAIVDATALATMISNHLVFPALLRENVRRPAGVIGARMLMVRRLSILAIMLLSLIWALLVSDSNSLASIGLIAFSAMAQFTPHLILATRGGSRDPLAAQVSLSAGLGLWLYTLALPPILPQQWLAILRGTMLDPLQLFGIGSATPLVHGVFWSLGVNLLILAALSARSIPGPVFPRFFRAERTVSDLPSLVDLTASFIGRERAEIEFPNAAPGKPVDRNSARRAQDLIARVVGASSARALVASALAGGTMSLPEVTRLLDEGGQSLRFSRQLLASTFENIDAGISVVDAELNLVAWNTRYLDLFDYPAGLVKVGVSVAELIRHNARRGDFGDGDVEFHVEKRLSHLRRGLEHSFERRRSDGRVLKTVGGPMPGGGYVMSFSDITEEARVREELRRTLEGLESRVAERTSELSAANRLLAESDADKTRFLAAASHDLLQPLHAARLFSAALKREIDEAPAILLSQIESAIIAAEDLLRALLDISKLDAGGIEPQLEPVDLAHFLGDLVASVRPLAEEKGLRLRLGPVRGMVVTDPALLRSVMQNFLTNAVRYTPRGGVVVGVRRRGATWRIDVVDSGIGIAPDRIEAAFGEFTRLGEVDVEGLGLGLALVRRLARLLGGTVSVASTPGKGSRFSFALPASDDVLPDRPARKESHAAEVRPLSILVVDNDARIIAATSALLRGLGHRPLCAGDIATALTLADQADAVLADFQLDDGEDGLSLIAALWEHRPKLPVRLITAESGPKMRVRAQQMGVKIFAKPVDPTLIDQFLADISMFQVEP